MFTDQLRYRQGGVTLIELIMFIMIVSIGITGILLVMNFTTRHSAAPLLRKQAMAIAESLLEEIQLQPFTFCDPDDPNASTAANAAACTIPQNLAPTAGEDRYAEPRFDNVGDYNGFRMNGIRDLNGTVIGGLNGYTAAVAINAVGTATFGFPAANNGDALQIDVTVTGPGGEAATLTGYRFRYAPRAVP